MAIWILCTTLCLPVLWPGGEDDVAPAVPIADLAAVDLEGRVHHFDQGRPVAIVLVATECPIANQYVPELGRIAREADALGVDFLGLISDPRISREAARAHASEYGIEFPVLLDTTGVLALRLAPARTPEAFLFRADGGLAYRGRVDDRFPDLGQARTEPRRRDFAEAIADVALGREVQVAKTETVGCLFEAWSAESEESEVTWARHVAPILQARCVECHRAGEVAPFSLETYADAARRARMLALVTGRRYMPPWRPAPDFGRFRGERRLSEREIEVLARWANAGAPEGDPREAPPPRSFPSGWRLGKPDLVLRAPELALPADGPDVFQCFVLPTGLVGDRWVSAIEFRPGNPAVVHHALVYLDDSGRARELDRETPGPGYARFGGIGFDPSGALGGWAPGIQPEHLPAGTGRRLKRGSDVVLQVHYHPSGKPEADRSQLAIWFAKERVERRVRTLSVHTKELDIRPGDADYRVHAERVLERDLDVIGAAPHMHWLGREMKVVAHTPDGTEVPIIHVPEWNFFWQGIYRYREPFVLPAGTRLVLDARYDNSSENPLNPNHPPQHVTYGEESTDEMCFCFLEVAPR